MIFFNFKTKNPIPYPFPIKYPDILKYEGSFSIKVNERIYFYEPNFPIFEFLIFIDQWKQSHGDMNYTSIETDESPLISFIYKNGLFFLKSPWELYELHEGFSKQELISQLNSLIFELEAQGVSSLSK